MQSTKDFAAMLVKDHGAANEKLKSIASEQNIALPTAIGEDHQKKYDKLAAKSGKDFDKAYCEMMKDGHASAVDMFEKEARDGKNLALKQFASSTLPTLKMHKDKINAIEEAMK
jgi:putative membrane protein